MKSRATTHQNEKKGEDPDGKWYEVKKGISRD